MGGPVIRVLLKGVRIQFVDEKMELVGLPVPAGRLGGSQSDPTERFGLLHVVVVIIADEPLVAAIGLVEPAQGAGQFGQQPAGVQLIAVELDGLRGPLPGFIDRAALESQRRQFRRHVGTLAGRSQQRLLGLVILAPGRQAAGQPHGRRQTPLARLRERGRG